MTSETSTIAERLKAFNSSLAAVQLALPEGFRLINPFQDEDNSQVFEVSSAFYERFYADNRARRVILGSSPARRGTAVTGVPFADAEFLRRDLGVSVEGYSVSRSSSSFLDDVIHELGGYEVFYSRYLMGFVCPLGIVRSKAQRREVNANYYDTKALRDSLRGFVTENLRFLVDSGVDTSICYCIGSGQNFQFLEDLNRVEHFFDEIVALEHPRYIMQYHPRDVSTYKRKYMSALSQGPA